MKVYGPYTRKDGRKIVVIQREDGTKTSKSYPKYLMELHLNQALKPDDTVDHVNRDFTDDALDNLQILNRPTHTALDATRVLPVLIECAWCGMMIEKSGNKLDDNERQGKAGPFCGRSCAGQYSRQVQLGNIEPMGRISYRGKRQYYKLNKPR